MADPYSLDAVREVIAARKSEILQRFGATGVGIGRPNPAGPYIISVYVPSDTVVPADPQTVDGVALQIVVTDQFRPL